MIKKYWKLVLAIVLFVVGVNLVLDALTLPDRLWLLAPGILLLIVSYPLAYIYYYRSNNSYQGSRENDALEQAKRELLAKGIDHDKK